MQDYSAQVAPADRWAIAAYIRTLQFSRHATAVDVPPTRVARSTARGRRAGRPTHGAGASSS